MKSLEIEGFGRIKPFTGFALALFGPEGGGKTRLIAQAQAEAFMEDMETGVIVLDAKTRDTLEKECRTLGVPMPLTNKKDYITPQDAMKIAMIDETSDAGIAEIKKFYGAVVDKIAQDSIRLAAHPKISVVSIDPFTELYDYMFFETFGRKTQIGQLSRVAVNQRVIDFIKALRHKDLILTHREASIYADKGKRDRNTGAIVQEDTGRKKLSGYKDIGYQVSAIIHLQKDVRPKRTDDDPKYIAEVQMSQLTPDLEGDREEFTDGDITWSNLKEKLWPRNL